eukprot:GHVU01138341.1.p1 GENE.GHVU01138341.1~~GHVU01138341.1.p1  ORF type:complete len:121 (-),score=3.53 GHVU01138341.1:378-740(-)
MALYYRRVHRLTNSGLDGGLSAAMVSRSLCQVCRCFFPGCSFSCCCLFSSSFSFCFCSSLSFSFCPSLPFSFCSSFSFSCCLSFPSSASCRCARFCIHSFEPAPPWTPRNQIAADNDDDE